MTEQTTTTTPTERESEAVRLYDEGMTNAQIGESLGITAGAAGNLKLQGLRKLGRESEVGTRRGNGGGTSKVSVADPSEVLNRAFEQLDAQVTRAEQQVHDAREQVGGFDAKQWRSRQVSESKVRAMQLREQADQLDGVKPSDFDAEAEVARLNEAVAQAEQRMAEVIEQTSAARAQYEAAMEAVGQLTS